MLITAFYLFRLDGHQEPRNEVGSLSLTERLAAPDLTDSYRNVLTH